MPLIETKGAASAQGFGEFLRQGPVNYIEDVFSTYLYTGNGSTQTITNGIDLAGKGGLVWFKCRSSAFDNRLFDTARGATQSIASNLTTAQTTGAGTIAFGTTGFTTPNNEATSSRLNETYVSWTFRKQPKFFDVVTWTGNGSSSRAINHSLASVPGCIIVKRTDTTSDWRTYNQDLDYLASLKLNSTAAVDYPNSTIWAGYPTSTQFFVSNGADVNASGGTYVAYLFAHNAGGFGLTGSDNVISCGLTTADGSGNFSVNLGYEPQWVLMKSTGAGIWSIIDNMRGMTASSGYTSSQRLQPQSSAAEDQLSSPYGIGINATGFAGNLATFSNDFIYIAIRRGPMKVPTSGTSVFMPLTRTGTGASATVSGVGFPPDLVMPIGRSPAGYGDNPIDRLRGNSVFLKTYSTAAEVTDAAALPAWTMDGFTVGASGTTNDSGVTYVYENFRRAPGFADVVCYTGDGSASPRNISHNLAAIPELIIIKNRSFAENDAWPVFGSTVGSNQWMNLWKVNGASAYSGAGIGNTATTFQVPNGGSQWNNSPYTYVAYLFATCAGVSKVGSYTGTGALQTINCGFTGGARFVLIKRKDSTGDWYVYDSARGISSGNDPYLFLNSTAAEVTGTNYVDTTSVGFQVTAAAPAGLNANGGTYIFLAIA